MEAADGKSAGRVFVALKVAPEIAEALVQMSSAIGSSLRSRLIVPADIHLTLVPPWNETLIPAAIDKLRGVANKAVPFTLDFAAFVLWPTNHGVRGYCGQSARPAKSWRRLHTALSDRRSGKVIEGRSVRMSRWPAFAAVASAVARKQSD